MPIRIRPQEMEDADAIYEAVRESLGELSRWMPWCGPDYSRDDTTAWLAKQREHRAAGTEYNFVIEDEEGELLGCCGLNRIDPLNRTANLGYWVRTRATGQGVATAAVGLLKSWAFTQTDLHRLELLVAVENHASQRVARKSGAIQEANLKERLFVNGHWRDAVLFALLRATTRDASACGG